MTALVGALCGLATAQVLLIAMRRGLLAHPVLVRRNYRDVAIATAGGLVVVLTVVAVEGLRAAVAASGIGDEVGSPRAVYVLIVVVFGLLGLLDDVLGESTGVGGDRGLRGHLRALAAGRVTSGLVKFAGGGLVGLLAVPALSGSTGWRWWLDGALIAMFANLINLFDRAPGRAAKVALLAGLPFVIFAVDSDAAIAVSVVLGATAVVLVDDVRERIMLGDTGANAIGAAIGALVVATTSPTTRAVVAGGLFLLTVVSERVSFSRVIEATPPLRAIDRIGRLR